jgi:uncharacterized protein
MVAQITQSPALVRAVPFALFLSLTFLQDHLGETGRYWVYLLKSIVGAVLLWLVYKHVSELEWRFSWAAVAVGVGVFVMWVALDPFYPRLDRIYPEYLCPLLEKFGMVQTCEGNVTPLRSPWNPHAAFGSNSALAIFFVSIRILGSTFVVPMLEEMFYRSFVYRFIASKDFLSIPLGKWMPFPFLITALIFGFAHYEWLAAILCGFAYHGLVLWKGRLGDAVTAHAITNFLLGIWIAWQGAWHFW